MPHLKPGHASLAFGAKFVFFFAPAKCGPSNRKQHLSFLIMAQGFWLVSSVFPWPFPATSELGSAITWTFTKTCTG